MNENKTQDRLTIPHPTWQVTARRTGATWKIIAISPDRKRVLHADKVTDADLAVFDPESRWDGKAAPKIVDFVADLGVKS